MDHEFHVANESRASGRYVVVTHRSTGMQRVAGPLSPEDARRAAERLAEEMRADLARLDLGSADPEPELDAEKTARWLEAIQQHLRAEGQEPAPPARADQLEEAEARLGFPLPPTLRLLYTEIGNGGFGPGYGLMGVVDGAPDDEGETLDAWYVRMREAGPDAAGWCWPERLLPLCTHGCAIYSCVDAASPDEQVLRLDPHDAERAIVKCCGSG